MKSLLLLVSMALSLNVASQTELPTRSQIDSIREVHVQNLNLTESQKTSFDGIFDEYAAKVEEIQGTDASRFSKMKSLKSATQERNEELKSVLTEEQMEAFKASQKENVQKLKDRYKSGKRG